MHEADILAAVRKSRYRFLTRIADTYGVSDIQLRAALRRPQLSAERVISKATGIPLHVLWPQRWSPSGDRLVRRGLKRAA